MSKIDINDKKLKKIKYFDDNIIKQFEFEEYKKIIDLINNVLKFKADEKKKKKKFKNIENFYQKVIIYDNERKELHFKIKIDKKQKFITFFMNITTDKDFNKKLIDNEIKMNLYDQFEIKNLIIKQLELIFINLSKK